jgi:octopine/nopaline transport system substrate-binding protein
MEKKDKRYNDLVEQDFLFYEKEKKMTEKEKLKASQDYEKYLDFLTSNHVKYENKDVVVSEIKPTQGELDIKKVLKNTVIGVQKGTTPAYFAEKMLKGIAKIKYYDTQNQLVLDLNSGRIFAGFSEIIPIQESISNSKNLILFGKLFDNKDSDVFGKGIAIGINQENQELLNKINLALKSMLEDGFIKNLSLKYFKTDVSISINK